MSTTSTTSTTSTSTVAKSTAGAELIIPEEAPEAAPLKLVTMTIDSCIRDADGRPINLNLDVIFRHMALDDKVTSIKYRDMVRTMNSDGTEAEVDYHTDGGSGRFKNQCTLLINVGDKVINTKLFGNGKTVNVGCKAPEHAVQTSEILVQRICGMEGLVIYDIPTCSQTKNMKKFFKDDLRKKYGELIQLLVCELELDTNIGPFDPSLTADESYKIYMEEIEANPHYEGDIAYIHTIIDILKHYYDETQLVSSFSQPEFRYLLFMITEHTDREKGEISCEFPAYLNNKRPVTFNPALIDTVLINKSTYCGYFVNRGVLVSLMSKEPDVAKPKFDKNRYQGVILVYKIPDDPQGATTTIIVFNTGKINITAARTHAQIEAAYQFITKFCRDHFHELILETEYHNKNKEYEDSLPSQFYVGVIEEQQYFLLKKSNITSNPRNIRFLNTKKLLTRYISREAKKVKV